MKQEFFSYLLIFYTNIHSGYNMTVFHACMVNQKSCRTGITAASLTDSDPVHDTAV